MKNKRSLFDFNEVVFVYSKTYTSKKKVSFMIKIQKIINNFFMKRIAKKLGKYFKMLNEKIDEKILLFRQDRISKMNKNIELKKFNEQEII